MTVPPSYSLAREYDRELHLELRKAIATTTRVRLICYGVGHLAQIRDIKQHEIIVNELENEVLRNYCVIDVRLSSVILPTRQG